jgi:hypothetical protein
VGMIMTSKRFNQMLNGPLRHPIPMFSMMRLAMALRAVVDATGQAGEDALEKHCREREEDDERKAEEEY